MRLALTSPFLGSIRLPRSMEPRGGSTLRSDEPAEGPPGVMSSRMRLLRSRCSSSPQAVTSLSRTVTALFSACGAPADPSVLAVAGPAPLACLRSSRFALSIVSNCSPMSRSMVLYWLNSGPVYRRRQITSYLVSPASFTFGCCRPRTGARAGEGGAGTQGSRQCHGLAPSLPRGKGQGRARRAGLARTKAGIPEGRQGFNGTD
eukprot:3938055-Rhodomonas_salina.1